MIPGIKSWCESNLIFIDPLTNEKATLYYLITTHANALSLEMFKISTEAQIKLTLFSFESLLIVSVVDSWDRLLVSNGRVLEAR